MSEHIVPERLQKLIAKAGFGSRREIEGWIRAGEVKVNGEIATLGTRATVKDRVTHRGRVIHLNRWGRHVPRAIAYYKPEGEIVTRNDPQRRESVYEHLPRGRWVNVGRLDINTSGLLIFTSDGELAHQLMHPSNAIEREYAVRIRGQVDEPQLERLRTGVVLEDGPACFDEVVDAGGSGGVNRWFHVVIKEGRKREVRRLWESVGVAVSRLIRVRYGPIRLGRKLRSGRWRYLETEELRQLYKAVGLEEPPLEVPARGPRTGRRR